MCCAALAGNSKPITNLSKILVQILRRKRRSRRWEFRPQHNYLAFLHGCMHIVRFASVHTARSMSLASNTYTLEAGACLWGVLYNDGTA